MDIELGEAQDRQHRAQHPPRRVQTGSNCWYSTRRTASQTGDMVDYSKWDNFDDSSDDEQPAAAAPPRPPQPAAAAAPPPSSDDELAASAPPPNGWLGAKRGKCAHPCCGKAAMIGPCRACKRSYCSRECEFAPFAHGERRCPGIIEIKAGASVVRATAGATGGIRHHAETFWKQCDVSSEAALDAATRECADLDDAMRAYRKNERDFRAGDMDADI